ncbi:transient receptor potential cation channel subfamily A member 1 homolog isoform X2 [Clytia hemisphaerica]|uniref:transient receptor potential cation channel subfamily A member 1 homolog isoform X2 n=1 Tax=Clytia hemisphaerica TaxID=252671 RepID=UPI0034D45808
MARNLPTIFIQTLETHDEFDTDDLMVAGTGTTNYGMDGVYQNGLTPANGGPHLNNNNMGGTTGDIKLEEQVPYNGLQREKLSFHQAARYGNEMIVKKYLQKYKKRSRKINKLNRQELSALHYAVRHGHMGVIDLLVKGRANVNVAGSDGALPIHFAAKYFRKDKHVAITMNTPLDEDVADEKPILHVAAVKSGFTTATAAGVEQVAELLPDAIVNEEVEDVISYLLHHGANINAGDNYNQTPLNYAAIKGNIEAITLLINWTETENEIDIGMKDTSGATPLHNACGNGHVQAAKILLLSGAELMSWDNEHMNPLHYAATGDGSKVLREIIMDIEKGGGMWRDWSLSQIINDKNVEGESLLHLAVANDDYRTCCLVIEKGADVNLCRDGFITPLHLAATSGSVEICKLLVASKADLEAQNEDLQTPLHKAARNNRTGVVEFLLSKGCDINAYDNENQTPLMLAVGNGHKETVEILLSHDADLSIVDLYEKSVIFCAAEENAIEVLKLLLEKTKSRENDFEVMINQVDRFENTPLHAASLHGYIHIVSLLLDYGADIDVWNDEDNTPLHLACIHGNKKVAKILLANKPSIINDEDESGNTPLHLAALNGHFKIIDMLVDQGASVDPRNILQWTPLDCAAAKGFKKCVKVLLEYDAPIDPCDIARTTPLHLACQEGHDQVVSVLLKEGADITLCDHSGKNALDMAIEKSHKKVAKVLLGHKEWITLMRNRTKYGKVIRSPMRQLITKLPDVAHIVLNKCMDLTNTVTPDDPDYKVKFFYEFIDDTFCDWNPDFMDSQYLGHKDEDTRSIASQTTTTSLLKDADANQLTRKNQHLLQLKENHPIYLMCKHKRSNLLNHPLVLSLIYHKWQNFGRLVFYSKFAIYFIFLLFLTGYVLVTKPLLPRNVAVNGTSACIKRATLADKEATLTFMFHHIGRIVVLVLASLQLLLELIQLINRQLSYVADLTNWMEWLIYLLAIFFVREDYDWVTTSTSLCQLDSYFINIGALTIFLAWIDLLLFIQKFPSLGIYVVMFTDVTKTFLKFSITFILFVLAFGFSFFFLIGDKFLTFSNTGRSFLKTIVMMIGEFDYDNIFSEAGYKPPTATWILFFFFVIIMTILLMNLMVGLAVDDIKGVLDMAVLNRVAMQVHLVLDVEKSLPKTFRKRYVIKDKIVYPNRDFRWISLISHITKMDEINEALNPTKSIQEIVAEHTGSIRDSVDSLQKESKDTKKQIRNIEQMLERLLKHSNVNDNDDDEQIWDW